VKRRGGGIFQLGERRFPKRGAPFGDYWREAPTQGTSRGYGGRWPIKTSEFLKNAVSRQVVVWNPQGGKGRSILGGVSDPAASRESLLKNELLGKKNARGKVQALRRTGNCRANPDAGQRGGGKTVKGSITRNRVADATPPGKHEKNGGIKQRGVR